MFSSAFSSAFALPSVAYITPMLAQEALYAGAAWHFGGVLRVGGKVLIGLSGKPYAFVSAETAESWCVYGRRVVEGERALVDRLTEPVRVAWVAKKREKLLQRAAAIYDRALSQKEDALRAALIGEAAWCETKWAAYE